MPKTKTLTAKEQSAIQSYCEPTSKTFNVWSKSYLLAGYSNCQGWERNASKVLVKDRVKNAIVKYRKNIKEKISVTREYCINKLVDIVEDKTSSHRDIISAIGGIGDFAGYKRELAPNQERQQARHNLLSDEVKEIMKLVRGRTAQLSLCSDIKPKKVKANVTDTVTSDKD